MNSNDSEEMKCIVADSDPPIMPEYLKNGLSFDLIYSPKTVVDFYDTVLTYCFQLKAKVLKANKKEHAWKIKAEFMPTVNTGLGSIYVTFKFYSFHGISAVYVQRNGGDLFEYHKIYKFFSDAVVPSYERPLISSYERTNSTTDYSVIDLLP